MEFCKECSHANPEESRFCNACGARLGEPDARVPPDVAKDRTPCPRCGTGVASYMSFCPNCAMSLRSLIQTVPSERVGRCSECGRAISPGATVCALCSSKLWLDSEGNAPTRWKRLDRPTIVGILLVGSAALTVISVVSLILNGEVAVQAAEPVEISGFLSCCGVILASSAACSFAGALLSFRRERHTYVVLAAAIGMLGVGPFFLASIMSLLALILAAFSATDYG
ncbi:MAG: zinc ribbon domain-containing protein [Methanobacteriota archaeon]|nr:MAG: zinc ribbon domain-containing protein [Euryarchaeota archaeon]